MAPLDYLVPGHIRRGGRHALLAAGVFCTSLPDNPEARLFAEPPAPLSGAHLFRLIGRAPAGIRTASGHRHA
jgi:hypothetical protein